MVVKLTPCQQKVCTNLIIHFILKTICIKSHVNSQSFVYFQCFCFFSTSTFFVGPTGMEVVKYILSSFLQASSPYHTTLLQKTSVFLSVSWRISLSAEKTMISNARVLNVYSVSILPYTVCEIFNHISVCKYPSLETWLD